MEIWKMTAHEYIQSMKGKRVKHSYYNRRGQLIHDHQNEVTWALQLGRDVPARVLESMPYPFNMTTRHGVT